MFNKITLFLEILTCKIKIQKQAITLIVARINVLPF